MQPTSRRDDFGVTSFLTQTDISGGDADGVNQRCTGPGGTFVPCP